MEQASRHPALRTERPSCNRNGQYPHGKRKAAIGEQCKFSALLKMLRGGTPEARAAITMPAPSSQIAAVAPARGGARHYSRWPDPWRAEDDWGPIIAAVVFLIILGALIASGSGVHLG
jgi:hypothetical protein